MRFKTLSVIVVIAILISQARANNHDCTEVISSYDTWSAQLAWFIFEDRRIKHGIKQIRMIRGELKNEKLLSEVMTQLKADNTNLEASLLSARNRYDQALKAKNDSGC